MLWISRSLSKTSEVHPLGRSTDSGGCLEYTQVLMTIYFHEKRNIYKKFLKHPLGHLGQTILTFPIETLQWRWLELCCSLTYCSLPC